MVLELYVWGPAFSLPSLDSQCLAAIAYLTQSVPQNQWVLIASSDAGWSPTKELPALCDDGTTVGGYQNIIEYLQQKSDGEWDLDQAHTDPVDLADITAFSSHLTAHIHPLLSLSLYVSSENYTTTTRPSYTALLPWPTQYFIPPAHRSRAKTLSRHLNLSSLDLDHLDAEDLRRKKFTDAIPAALRTSQQTVTGLVNKSQTKARFRLDALVDAACEPLQQLLGEKKWFLAGDRMSSLDCLALGYLALALKPDLPQKWLAEGLRDRYPRLCGFVERGVEECFGGTTVVNDALISTTTESEPTKEGHRNETLPWVPPSQNPLATTTSLLLTSVTPTLPFPLPYHFPTTPPTNFSTKPPSSSTLIPTIITASTAITAAAAGYLLYSISLNAEPEKHSLADLGEAGAMFAELDLGGGGVGERGRGVGMRGGKSEREM